MIFTIETEKLKQCYILCHFLCSVEFFLLITDLFFASLKTLKLTIAYTHNCHPLSKKCVFEVDRDDYTPWIKMQRTSECVVPRLNWYLCNVTPALIVSEEEDGSLWDKQEVCCVITSPRNVREASTMKALQCGFKKTWIGMIPKNILKWKRDIS